MPRVDDPRAVLHLESAMVRRTIVSLAFALVVAAPSMIGVAPVRADETDQISVQSAFPDLAGGVLTLRGDFGTSQVSVWIAGLQLAIVSQSSNELVVTLPTDLAPGTYDVIVVREPGHG